MSEIVESGENIGDEGNVGDGFGVSSLFKVPSAIPSTIDGKIFRNPEHS